MLTTDTVAPAVLGELGWHAGTIGEVDHACLKVPSVKLRGAHRGAAGDVLYCIDLRWRRPNAGENLAVAAAHSLEHFLLEAFSRHLPGKFVGVGVMGCLTGFYLTMLDEGRRQVIEDTLEAALHDVLVAREVPYACARQCGDFRNHDLAAAQAVAREVLARRRLWQEVM